MRLTRTITNIDTNEQENIGVSVAETVGGYTTQIFAISPTSIFPTADAAADAYAADAQAAYDADVIANRGRRPAPCCHFCGQELNRRGECGECR